MAERRRTMVTVFARGSERAVVSLSRSSKFRIRRFNGLRRTH